MAQQQINSPAEKKGLSNFWQRTITGTLFVAVLVGAVLWSKYSFVGLFFIITVLSLREFAMLFKDRAIRPNVWITTIAGGIFSMLWCITNLNLSPLSKGFDTAATDDRWAAYTLFCVIGLAVLAHMLVSRKQKLKSTLLSLSGIFYINIGFASFVNIGFFRWEGAAGDPYYSKLVIAFLILLWSSDTFAYLTGRAFGKTPLAPKISPKKTIEGSIGGAVCTMGLSYLMYLQTGFFSAAAWMLFALVIVIFGTMGDLIESKLKRTLGIKDSGNILPGHGGLLDRFDSLLFSAPFAFIFLVMTEIFKI